MNSSDHQQKLIDSLVYSMLKSLRSSVKEITSSTVGYERLCGRHYLNGTFKKLCDKQKMTQLLFPGTSSEVLSNLPKDLREVLCWKELNIDLIKVAKNAAVVLNNIKNKGAQRGDIMDEETENVLLPQIAQESLANEIMEAARVLNRKVSSVVAKMALVASVDDVAEDTDLDQLSEAAIISLFKENSFASQSQFLGEDWADAISNDMIRYCRDERMTALNRFGAVETSSVHELDTAEPTASLMAWVEPSQHISETYPAIFELIKQLHALPYELNVKSSVVSTVKLLQPAKGCTMLVHYPKGCVQAPRLDSREDGGSQDSGIRVTCAYHVVPGEEESPSSLVMVDREDPNRLVSFPVASDLLTLHLSTRVRNERTIATSDYFTLLFFMHGQQPL